MVQPGQAPPAQSSQAPGAESTQLVPPGMQPAIPYTPPPSAADNPGAMGQQGFGQQGFGQQGGFPPQQQGGYPQGPQSGGFPPQGPQSGGFPPPPQGPQSGGFPPPPGQPYGYGQQPGFGAPAFTGPPGGGQLAEWFPRVAAYLIDIAPILVVLLLAFVGGMIDPMVGALLSVLGYLAFIGWVIYNRWIQQGKTGQSLGKKMMKIKLIGEQTGQPIGGGMAFVRDLAHILDGLPCYLGYLWPLWDEKKQTFGDKIMTTVVVTADGAAPSGGFGQQGPPSGGFGQPGPQGGFGQPPQGPSSGGFPQQGPPPGYGQPPQGPSSGGFPQQGPPQGYGQPPYQG
ncbi:RDD family protein [Actinokineospora sp.]|uniref:RDD family protein n=1 Tax=Actinokineospora sp. TaxID=1872133 RepID=UPI003D6BCF44